ncbi:MAG TPA: hypothetical protein VHE80_05795 [Acidimicrobiales bacterium]|nr:hypothetical protein [Acidimicrobiales bacterium]
MTVGIIFEDLEDHEGYAARRLPEGRLTSAQTPATARFEAYVAACACGWTGSHHPPTEEGRARAEAAWEADHAQGLLRRAVPHEVAQAVAEARRQVGELARRRPVAAIAVLRDLGTWAERVAELASSCAREQGEHVDPPHSPVRRPPARRGGPALGL